MYFRATASFIKKFPPLYTLLMNTIYLSLSTEVAAEGTGFRKHTVYVYNLQTVFSEGVLKTCL